VIFDNGGTLDKYIGDAVMRSGAPIFEGQRCCQRVDFGIRSSALIELNRDAAAQLARLRVGIRASITERYRGEHRLTTTA
jgi:hypothetical protein